MGEFKHSDHTHGSRAERSAQHAGLPYWRRAHRDWRFWVAICFIFGALAVYIVSDDLALVPQGQPRSLSNASK